jgi:hypothetical protein
MATSPAEDRRRQDPVDPQEEIRHLRRALSTRPTIDLAKGMLMAKNGCTADEAFAMLAAASQRANRKVSDIAQAMINNAAGGQHPRLIAGRPSSAAPERVPSPEPDTATPRTGAVGAYDASQAQEAVRAEHELEPDVDAVMARALARDQLAERRDRQAEARDLAAARRPSGQGDGSVGAESERAQAAIDRVLSGLDRDWSAADRADLRASRKPVAVRSAAAADVLPHGVEGVRSAVAPFDADQDRQAPEADPCTAAAERKAAGSV